MTPSNCFWNNSPLPGTEISVMALPPSYLSFYYFIILATTYWRKANFQTNSSHSQPKVLSLQFPEAGHERCVSPRTVFHFCCLKYTAHPNPWTPLTSNDHPKTGDNFSSHVFLSTAPACIGSPVFTNTTASLSEGSGPIITQKLHSFSASLSLESEHDVVGLKSENFWLSSQSLHLYALMWQVSSSETWEDKKASSLQAGGRIN